MDHVKPVYERLEWKGLGTEHRVYSGIYSRLGVISMLVLLSVHYDDDDDDDDNSSTKYQCFIMIMYHLTPVSTSQFLKSR